MCGCPKLPRGSSRPCVPLHPGRGPRPPPWGRRAADRQHLRLGKPFGQRLGRPSPPAPSPMVLQADRQKGQEAQGRTWAQVGLDGGMDRTCLRPRVRTAQRSPGRAPPLCGRVGGRGGHGGQQAGGRPCPSAIYAAHQQDPPAPPPVPLLRVPPVRASRSPVSTRPAAGTPPASCETRVRATRASLGHHWQGRLGRGPPSQPPVRVHVGPMRLDLSRSPSPRAQCGAERGHGCQREPAGKGPRQPHGTVGAEGAGAGASPTQAPSSCTQPTSHWLQSLLVGPVHVSHDSSQAGRQRWEVCYV